MLRFGLFLAGFPALIFGCRWLARGAQGISKRFGLSPFLIGFIVVGIFASLPEALVGIFNTDSGRPEVTITEQVAISVTLGLLIFGLLSMLRPMNITKNLVAGPGVQLLFANLFALLLAADIWFMDTPSFRGIDKADGLVLLSTYVLFLWLALQAGWQNRPELKPLMSKTLPLRPLSLRLWFLVIGAVVAYLGSKWIADGVVLAIGTLGFGGSFLTTAVTAFGATLTEIILAIGAVRKNKVDLAIGIILGGILFNILFVLGLASFLYTLSASSFQLIHLLVSLIVIGSILFSIRFGRPKYQVDAFRGQMYLIFYLLFLLTLPLI